jgi:hypothetical protein
MFIDFFRVYKSHHTKIRVGKENDGGYIICDIPNIKYEMLLSAGICDDISFEEAFLEKYPNTSCFAFDGTVESFPPTTKSIFFLKKNISSESNEHETNLIEYCNYANTIFLKMDIEGAEVKWIHSLPEDILNKFAQITMEWHNPFYLPMEQEAFVKLLKTHVLVHFHGNNCRGFETVDGVQVPYTFECTYIHKKYYEGPIELNQECIPTSLDMPNDKSKPDLFIDYDPFVHHF